MLKAIHIYDSLKPTHKPKIAKEYAFASAINRTKKRMKTHHTLNVKA